MKRWVIRLLVVVAVFFGFMAVGGLVIRSFLSGSQKDRLVAVLSERMGAPVTVANVGVDLRQLLLFHPAVALETVTVANPPGYQGKDLFEAKRIAVQVSLAALLRKNIDVQSILVDSPKIMVETNARGVTNIAALLKNVSSTSTQASGTGGGSTSAGSGMNLAIDKLTIKSGTVTIAGKQSTSVHEMDITMRDFSGDRRCRVEASANFFDGKSSNFKLDGQAGPFGPESLPIDGTLTIKVAPAEIPAAVRIEQFGKLLGAPGSKSRATIEATVRGDLYKTVTGPATLTLADLEVGKDAAHVIPLSGNAKASIAAIDLMGTPQFTLDIPGAIFHLGKGEWSGAVKVDVQGTTMTGSSHGAIRNMDINSLVGSFTTAHDKLYGLVAIPTYSLQFAGKNAEQMRNSLHGTGKLSITQGRVAMMDFAATLERALGQKQGETAGTKGVTAFNTLTADLVVGGAKMEVNNLNMDGPSLRATGNGVIGFDESLHFNLIAHVTGGLARLVSTIGFRPPSGDAQVPVTVSGTVEAPKVRPEIAQVAGGAVKGILDSFLKGKKQK